MQPTPDQEPYDLVVIGGGIIGSGVARDAALRGLRVALIEKHDFGWGTTARSTRLIHGGLRYLEHYDFLLVREALHERATLIRNAPHLVHPIAFLLPIFRGRGRGTVVLRLGLILYDVLARANLGWHHWWRRERVAREEPVLDRPDLRGAFLFWDAQASYPERLVVENVVDVLAHGGAALNHTEAIGLETDGAQAVAVRVRDRHSGQERLIPGRFFLNVGGPWVTEVDSRLGVRDPALTRRTKGVHLVVDPVTDHAMVLQCGDGERIIFIVPWAGYSLIGTTDTDYAGSNDTVAATPEDVRYLLDEANANLNLTLQPKDIHYTYAGLRPLIPEGRGSAGSVSRRHLLIDHGARGGPTNLVSVVGGKITSFRYIAENIVDKLRRRLGAPRSRATRRTPMPGGKPYDRTALLRAFGAALPHHTDEDVARLLGLYGARVADLLDVARAHPKDLGHLSPLSRLTREEVRFVVEREGARSVNDVLLRRTMLGLEADQARVVVEPLADYLARLRGWDRARRDSEVLAYLEHVGRERRAVDEVLGRYEEQAPDIWYAKRIR